MIKAFNPTPLSKARCIEENIFIGFFSLHPEVRGFKIRKVKGHFIVRAKYKKRRLISWSVTLERAFLSFIIEFQRKVLGMECKIEPYKTV